MAAALYISEIGSLIIMHFMGEVCEHHQRVEEEIHSFAFQVDACKANSM
jgi:hypothetical protein